MPFRQPHRLRAAALLSIAALTLSACGQTKTAGSTRGARPHAQANQLLDGGTKAFQTRLGGLRGTPVVVNQWASWCGPCRFEFPFFQHLSMRYDRRVAFLGVDSQDARGDARDFLKRFPVSYPHFYDKDASIARTFGGGRAWPTTAFFDAAGKLVSTHIGAYATEAKLDDDIVRYALHG